MTPRELRLNGFAIGHRKVRSTACRGAVVQLAVGTVMAMGAARHPPSRTGAAAASGAGVTHCPAHVPVSESEITQVKPARVNVVSCPPYRWVAVQAGDAPHAYAGFGTTPDVSQAAAVVSRSTGISCGDPAG